MKNLFLLSDRKRENKPLLILTYFFVVIFLSGPFSGEFLMLSPINDHRRANSENYEGGYTFFITPFDSAVKNHADPGDNPPAGKDEQNIITDTTLTVTETTLTITDTTHTETDTTYTVTDTTLTDLQKKATINYVIW